jgi:hypothetical protein
MLNDGSESIYYFCKKYLNVVGWDFVNDEDLKKCFEYLKDIMKK